MASYSWYPVVFSVRSTDLGGFVEVIQPRAVDRALTERSDVRALYAHDIAKPLGRIANRTLQLEKTARGLRATVQLDDRVSWARDLLALAERADAPGGSFGFHVLSDVWSLDRNGLPLREVVDMRLLEVSAGVSFPAYPATERASVRTSGESIAVAQRRLRQLLSR